MCRRDNAVKKNNTIDAFFALVQAGLWEEAVNLSGYGTIDYDRILQLAQEQAVVGLVAAGLEHVTDEKVSKEIVLQFVGLALQLEQRNMSMNIFVARLFEDLRDKGVYALLVKGQGIAECYERPQWRACGDVDLFLSDVNYEAAKSVLLPLASSVEKEGIAAKHQGMIIDGFDVELHGTLISGLSIRVDRSLREIKDAIFSEGKVRSWINGNTQVLLPSADEDAIYVFTHFLGHFYKGGIGLRQICDWTRLLWKYKNSLNQELLESRIRKMGLISEWRAFGAFAVDYLGMPKEAMPLYENSKCWKKKADRICSFIIRVGNFGHNRDMSFYHKGSYLMQKIKSFGRRCGDLLKHFIIFPLDTLRFVPCIIFNGVRSAVRGE